MSGSQKPKKHGSGDKKPDDGRGSENGNSEDYEDVLLELAIAFGQAIGCDGCSVDRAVVARLRELFDQTVRQALIKVPKIWDLGPQRTYVTGQVKKIAAEACTLANQTDGTITPEILSQAAAQRIAQQRVVCDKAEELKKRNPNFESMAQGGIFCPHA